MRQKCKECGDYLLVDEDGICGGCEQDRIDMEELEDWLPEDDEDMSKESE